MHIAVTGAAGFIGSHAAERLALDGHRVTGVDCFAPYYDLEQKRDNTSRLAELGIPVRKVDLATDPLAEVLAGVDGVVHLAAQPGLSPATERRAFVRNNVTATKRLVRAMEREPSVRVLVHASSSSVYGADATVPEDGPLHPASIYGRTKLASERIVRAASAEATWDACVVRLFSVYGPRERPEKLIPKAIRCALTGTAFPLFRSSERHRRSYTYVADAVDGLVAALHRIDRCAGHAVNVGTPTSVSTLDVLRCVAEVTGRPLCIDRVPPREGDQQRTEACIDKARRLLGVEPSTPLREGIAAEARWMTDMVERMEG